eukprot:jgi/Bigna1/81866/fgenesh1_pg.85_\
MLTIALVIVVATAHPQTQKPMGPIQGTSATMSVIPPKKPIGRSSNPGILPVFGPETHTDPIIKNTPNGISPDLPYEGVHFESNINHLYRGNDARTLSQKPGNLATPYRYIDYSKENVGSTDLKRAGGRNNVTVPTKPAQYGHPNKGVTTEFESVSES